MNALPKYILIAMLFISYAFSGSSKKKQQKVHLSTEQSKQKTPWVQKIIWTYWTEKIADDDHVRKIFEFNHKSQQKGWELRHLNNQNQYYWLNQIPDFGDKLEFPQFKNYKPHVRANLIRLALIKHFGGVYIDFTIILTSPLDWLLDIQNQKSISQKFGNQPSTLLLYSYHSENKTHFDQQLNKDVYVHPSYENFFIASKKGDSFIQDWFNFYVEAKNISERIYPLPSQKSWILQTARAQQIKIGGFNMKYFEVAVCGQIVLQRKQRELDKMWEKNNMKGPRPLAVKQYNIWSMNTSKIAYEIHNLVNFKTIKFMSVLMQSDKDYLKQNGVEVRYFIKLYNVLSRQLNRFLLNQTSIKQIICPSSFSILENSWGYQYLLKHYPIKFYSNKVVNVSYNRNCIKYQFMKLLKQPKAIATKGQIAKFQSLLNNNALSDSKTIQKIQETVSNVRSQLSNQFQQLSNEIRLFKSESLASINKQKQKQLKLGKDILQASQANYERMYNSVSESLNSMNQKQNGIIEKLLSFYTQLQQQEQYKKNIIYFFVLSDSVVTIVSGIFYIIQKLKKQEAESQIQKKSNNGFSS